MSRSRRQHVLVALLLAALAGWAIWGWGQFTDARARARAEAQAAAEVQQLAAAIESLRQRPSLVGERQLEAPELAQRIEQAMQQAGIPTENLERVTPEAPRRVGESDYQRLRTRVSLRRVRLDELIHCLHALTDEEPALTATALRLTAPRGEQISDRWHVEFELSHLTYQPGHGASTGPTGAGR